MKWKMVNEKETLIAYNGITSLPSGRTLDPSLRYGGKFGVKFLSWLLTQRDSVDWTAVGPSFRVDDDSPSNMFVLAHIYLRDIARVGDFDVEAPDDFIAALPDLRRDVVR